MKSLNTDTIVAVATPPGYGGVGIVRLSGVDALSIAMRMITVLIKPRIAQYTVFHAPDGDVIDEGIVLYFQNPHSFTGEDVVELQGHGGPMVMDRLIKAALHHGARMANPGEFSERAFLNHKMDLTQAEAIADLIHAQSEQAARSAVRSLQGVFSQKIHALQQSLINLRLQIEAMIDFPEEEIDFLSDSKISQLLQEAIDHVKQVKSQAQQGALLQNGLHVVIAGKPNAGKSSLLNYLSGRESAIVTNIPGTTRDILRESITIDGMPLHIIDTAGLRESCDAIEQEGIKRAYAHMQKADMILLVLDAQEMKTQLIDTVIADFQKTIPHDVPLLVIKNKIDLTQEKPGIFEVSGVMLVQLSITEKLGTDTLIQALKKQAGYQSAETDGFIARARHVDAIARAHQYLLEGQQHLHVHRAGELLAESLRQAQQALSEITGEFTADDLLGEIFSRFCVGK